MFKYILTLGLLCNVCFADEQTTEFAGISSPGYTMIGKKISPAKSPEVKVTYVNKDGYKVYENGVLISKKHVLMSANSTCYVKDNPETFSVQAGSQAIEVESIAVPDKLDCYSTTCDPSAIAVLTLKEKVKKNKWLKISKAGKRIKKKTVVKISGFGRANENDSFGILKWAKTKVESLQKEWAILVPYLNSYPYTDHEGASIVTVQVPNPKNKKKKVRALAAMGTCYFTLNGVKKDKVLKLGRKDLINFIKKATNKAAKFI